MVEHVAHHPKVAGLSPATTAGPVAQWPSGPMAQWPKMMGQVAPSCLNLAPKWGSQCVLNSVREPSALLANSGNLYIYFFFFNEPSLTSTSDSTALITVALTCYHLVGSYKFSTLLG